jgi:hypothetical protein
VTGRVLCFEGVKEGLYGQGNVGLVNALVGGFGRGCLQGL